MNLKCKRCGIVFEKPSPEPRILNCPNCHRYQDNLIPTLEKSTWYGCKHGAVYVSRKAYRLAKKVHC